MKDSRKAFKRAVRQAKRESWRDFCSSMMALPAVSRLHKILKRNQVIHQGTMKKSDGSFTVTPAETMEVMLNTHFPNLTDDDELLQSPDLDHGVMGVNIHSSFVNKERIKAALLSFSPYKAPGPDGISPILIQKGIDILSGLLKILYTACLERGYVPKTWQRARIVFLPKPGKDDYSSAKSYRPISLTSFLLKGLERLVHWHLQEGPLKRFPLHDRQFAYKAGVSTEDALHTLVARLEEAVFNKKIAIVVFLDIEGAFNNALATSMTQGLRTHGVEDSIVRWISFMLNHRTAEFDLLGVNVSKEVQKGCPQGGILSPLFWKYYREHLQYRVKHLLTMLKQCPLVS